MALVGIQSVKNSLLPSTQAPTSVFCPHFFPSAVPPFLNFTKYCCVRHYSISCKLKTGPAYTGLVFYSHPHTFSCINSSFSSFCRPSSSKTTRSFLLPFMITEPNSPPGKCPVNHWRDGEEGGLGQDPVALHCLLPFLHWAPR